jgi:hypothetical protein
MKTKLYCFYFKLNAVIGYIFLFLVDIYITLTSDKSWKHVHGKTLKVFNKTWNKF